MKTVIEMAKEAGFKKVGNGVSTLNGDYTIYGVSENALERFAALVREDERNKTTTDNLNCKSVQKRLATSWGYVLPEQAEAAVLAEREACAKVCESMFEDWQGTESDVAHDCAAAIRARGDNG